LEHGGKVSKSLKGFGFKSLKVSGFEKELGKYARVSDGSGILLRSLVFWNEMKQKI
jgi:hypothetical protein